MEKQRADIDENHQLHLANKRIVDAINDRLTNAEREIENLKAMEPITDPNGEFDGEGFMAKINDRVNKLRE